MSPLGLGVPDPPTNGALWKLKGERLGAACSRLFPLSSGIVGGSGIVGESGIVGAARVGVGDVERFSTGPGGSC